MSVGIGSMASAVVIPPGPAEFTGGTITYDGGYKIHRFTSSSTLTLSKSGTAISMAVLVVGAGGGAGSAAMPSPNNNACSGGGGGGQVLTGTLDISASTAVTVGTNPTGASPGAGGSVGGFSRIGSLTASGGAGGGGTDPLSFGGGSNGASGGGGRAVCTSTAVTSGGVGNPGGNGGSGQGVATAGEDSTRNAGGGGGAGGAGLNGTTTQKGNGGPGVYSDITGTNLMYGAGGGGGVGLRGLYSLDGAGNNSGTGSGGLSPSNNYRGFGGGGAGTSGGGGGGGTGVVVVRYRVAVKTAVRPGDIFYTPDPLIPVQATTGAYIYPYLTYAGFIPDPAFATLPWMGTSYFTYMGYNFYWTGTHWASGNGAGAQLNVGGLGNPMTGTGSEPHWARVATADMAAVLSARYKPTGTTAWSAKQWYWVNHCLFHWNGSSWDYQGPPNKDSNPNPKALWPDMITADPAITAEDQTNADKLTGLGYVPGMTYRWAYTSPSDSNKTAINGSYVSFMTFDPAHVADPFDRAHSFTWDGTKWIPWNAATTYKISVGYQTVTDPVIAALPANQRVVAMTQAGYHGGTAWTAPGVSATIGGTQAWWGPPTTTGSVSRWWIPGTA